MSDETFLYSSPHSKVKITTKLVVCSKLNKQLVTALNQAIYGRCCHGNNKGVPNTHR